MRLMMCAVVGLAAAGPVLGQSAAPSAAQDQGAIGRVMVYKPAPSSGGSGGVVLNWSGEGFQPAFEGRPGADAPITEIRSYIQQQREARELTVDDKPVTLRVTGASLQVYLGDEPYPESRMKSEDTRTVLLDSDGKPAGEMVVTGQRVELRPIQSEEQGRLLIGVSLSPVDSTLAKHLRIDAEKASLISGVTEGWPASKAGLESGDVIVAVEGRQDGTSEALRSVIAEHEAGDTIRLSVLSGGGRKDVLIRLSDEARASTGGIGTVNYVATGAPLQLSQLADEAAARGLAAASIAQEQGRAGRPTARAPRGGIGAGSPRSERSDAGARGLTELVRNLDAARVTVDIPSGGGRALVHSGSGGGERDIASRLESLEERTARMEEMLRKLIEQSGSR